MAQMKAMSLPPYSSIEVLIFSEWQDRDYSLVACCYSFLMYQNFIDTLQSIMQEKKKREQRKTTATTKRERKAEQSQPYSQGATGTC